MVKKSNLQEMANFGDYPGDVYQTLIWRPGETVQNLGSPRLSGRVDSPESLTNGTWVGFVNREVLHQHLLGKSLSPHIICLAF